MDTYFRVKEAGGDERAYMRMDVGSISGYDEDAKTIRD